ncbi:MAG: lamin tail domain-containing protein, partial [Calditrichaeota bacterium]
MDAVWRNNSLYTCATLVPGSGSDAGQATAHWWQINTSNISSLTLSDQGDIGGEDIATGTYTFFPSIAVDQHDNIAIGFSASAATIHPGAYYTGRLSTDPSGTVQSSGTLAAGVDYYIRTFGSGRNRWGDYTATVIDPTDENTFWVFNEYAITRGNPTTGGEDGQWGTRWGRFKLQPQGVNPGDIIITEIMQNPAAVSDANGEWFEIYNTTNSAIDIDGWTIRDDGTDSHTINNSGPLTVPAKGFLVLGIDSNSATNGNYTANYQYSGFTLDNGADEVVLEDLTGTVIDSVDYDGGVSFPNPTGASMALKVFTSDNNVGSNWTTSTSREPTFSGTSGDLGSPGTLGSDQALPVTLASFSLSAGDGEVTLQWATESETDNLGFKVFRA